MPLEFAPTRIALVVSLLVALGYLWYAEGRGRWVALVEDRLLYGVPWGTLVTVAILVAFYAVVQGGVRSWSEPLTLPFITWSYFYPTGLFTAGFAHGTPGHLASNTAGTLALAPIAEYAWGHYPPSSDRRTRTDGGSNVAADGEGTSLLARPWVRAVVVFPAALLVAAVLTAVFALGPGLGFSGAVFAIAGFAVVSYPLTTVVAVVVTTALQTLYQALTQPVVRETLEVGPPSPPGWAGVGFQAHLLGFLLGVLVGIALLRRRGRSPAGDRVFVGVVLFGMAQSLWLLVLTGDDVFYLYQGAGIVMLLALAVATTVAVAGSDRPIPPTFSRLSRRVPSREQLARGWLLVLAVVFLVGIVGAFLDDFSPVLTIAPLAVVVALLALPALPAVVPDRWLSSPVSRRGVAVGCLLAFTVVVVAPSVPLNLLVVGDDAVPGDGEVEVGGYAVTYEQNATAGQTPVIDPGPIPDPELDDDEEDDSEPDELEDAADDPFATQQSGVIVVNDDREIWTVGVRDSLLEHDREATVVVGGIGWQETVAVSRSGWDVIGNESSYAVDLETGADAVDADGGEAVRSFASEPIEAEVRVDGHTIAIEPGDGAGDAFELRVVADGEVVGTADIPAVNETATVGDLEFDTEAVGDVDRLYASADATDTEALIAERETDG
ncbi:rhomboid family intramembrane serine protease [Halobiforma nitratireducens]|uniref:Rhomboid family protein n=1 Tax=Halobiforma nitratireducens JCM 10879 TaxID=1227454 RepID=M0MIV0_9EURY|nr:rhomboid family intramembrane serine protease [Halobiforma nitratireducens]EMA44654.1 Rhomboid family protein [Halobiforma nitratireducens JCM 10879]